MKNTISRCTRCVMDATINDIEFDNNGVCNYCKNYELRIENEMIKDKKSALINLVHNIKKNGKGKDYDCLIGISGGVDSSYVAYLVKSLGLRPLAKHLDNGWNSDLAVSNIEKILSKLEIDLYTHVIDWQEFKDLQKSFIESSIANLEFPTDHAINALLLKTANKHKIKYVINGSNLVTEGILPVAWMGRNIDYRLLKNIHKRFGSLKLRSFPKLSLCELAYILLVKRIKFIPILNYVEYDKEGAMSFLESEYGWNKYDGKHFESIFTRFFQGYILPQKYNIDKRKAHLSTLIMSGQVSREDALLELKENPYKNSSKLLEDKKYILKKLSYSKEDFEKIMNSEVKSSKDYPSSDFLFNNFKSLLRIMKAFSKRG